MFVVMATRSFLTVMVSMVGAPGWVIPAAGYQLSKKSNPVFRMLLLVLN